MSSAGEYQDRHERQPEIVEFLSNGQRIPLSVVEERGPDDNGVRVVRLESAAPGWEAGTRVYVSSAGLVMHIVGLCRDCGAGPGRQHRACWWCPRAGRNVSRAGAGILRGWSA